MKLITGFTLTLDGDSEVVEAIWEAAYREMQKQFARVQREDEARERRVFNEIGRYLIPRYPVRYPVSGEIQLRTSP